MFTSVTTASLVKPIITMVDKLKRHIETQKELVVKQEEEIQSITKKREEVLEDIEYASKVTENLANILG